MSLPFHLIYHDAFTMDLGDHPFPVGKYRRIREKLIELGAAAETDFRTPSPATDEDILRVHRDDYVEKFKTGAFTDEEIRLLEIPWSAGLVRSMWLFAGGAILAAHSALRDGCAILIGGGFHHAFRDHGEGFCPINDTAVSIAALRVAGALERTVIVDLDVHQGNGNADMFLFDRWTHTLSLHQEDLYPPMKPPSTQDIGLPSGMGDEAYLDALEKPLRHALETKPDLIWYLAGADPYERDRLGGLGLTFKGLKERDRRVFRAARDAGVPVAVAFAGGYAVDPEDTSSIHANTVLAAAEVFAGAPVIDLAASGRALADGSDWLAIVDRTYRCVLRDHDDGPVLRTIEWTGLPPEMLLVTTPVAVGEVVAAEKDARLKLDQVAFRRSLFRPRVTVAYYEAVPPDAPVE